jgi:hypothetical protein
VIHLKLSLRRIFPSRIVLLSLLSLTACSPFHALEAPIDGRPAYPTLRDAEVSVTELTISRQFPGESPWNIKVIKKPNLPPETEWEIQSAPIPLSDLIADGTFIRHFISTLKTLHAIETPSSDLAERFGLKPERARVRWNAPGGQSETFLVGDEKNSGERYGRFKAEATAQVFSGAALRMLEILKGWESLRKVNILFRPLDDYDVVSIDGPKTSTKAPESTDYERVGTDWKRTKGVGLGLKSQTSPDIAPHFVRLFHFRVQKFYDEPEIQKNLQLTTDSQAPIYALRLEDRQAKVTTLQFYALKDYPGVTFLRSAERGRVVMGVYPEVVELLKLLTQSGPTPRKSSIK